MDYVSTGNTDSLAYAMTYLIQVFETSYTLDCTVSYVPDVFMGIG
jgi:hypothetical protein